MPVSSQDTVCYFLESGYLFVAIEAEQPLRSKNYLLTIKIRSTASSWPRGLS
jgi:hypothetical protein